jgi:protein-tyrosine phosphatase
MDLWNPRRGGEARSPRENQRPTVTELFHDLLIGDYPREEDIEWLKQTYGITAVLNLQDDEDFQIKGLDAAALQEACQRHGVKFVRRPIPDGSADQVAQHLERALSDLKALVDGGERVYVHCNAGLNRAPTIAIAYLRAHRQMSLNEAMAHVKKRRACGPFMTVLEDYFGSRDYKPGE